MKLIIMQGLPRSGKSTWALNYIKEHQNTKIFELDRFRHNIINNEINYDEDSEPYIWLLAREEVIRSLNRGHDVIIDECNNTVWCLDFWYTIKMYVMDLDIHIVRLQSTTDECFGHTNSLLMKSVIVRKSNNFMKLAAFKSWCKLNNVSWDIIL